MGKAMRKMARFRPQHVLRAADQLLETQRIKARPAWHASLQKVPPPQTLIRPIQHRISPHTPSDEDVFLRPGETIRNGRPTRVNGLATGGLAAAGASRMRESRRGMYKPKSINYTEDELRSEFFSDHPWELARPRVMVETGGGYDAKQWDWGRGIEQPGKQLDGESVVQRQNWLMKHHPFPSKAAAYDQARREFYTVRRKQEVERRIAVEEAQAVGAIFGPTTLEYGMRLEDAAWERFKKEAAMDLDRQETERASLAMSLGMDPEQQAKRDEAFGNRAFEDEAQRIRSPEEEQAARTRGGESHDFDASPQLVGRRERAWPV